MLSKVSPYFFPGHFHDTDENRRQATIIVNSVALTCLFTLNYVIVCAWLAYRPGLYLMIANLLVNVVALLAFKAGWLTYRTLGYLFTLDGVFFIFLTSVFLGGFYGDVTIWLVMLPMVGTLLLGKNGGWVVLAVSGAALLGLWWLEYRGIQLPDHLAFSEYRLFFRLNVLVGLMLIIVVIAFVFTSTNNRALRMVREQNELLRLRSVQLEKSLNELKRAQVQLVQKEKMASLGELTAGIAHEIQNPLNFVTNFAEVSTELVGELQADVLKNLPDREKVFAFELSGDITLNLEMIAQHGQRASSIVRGMLKHSSNSSSEHQPTDLNALIDEYLRLAYHGLLAKEEAISCQLETSFDPDLPLLNLAAQDIGRVVLNLLTNAFYAVQQKADRQPLSGYVPLVIVGTQQQNGQVAIHVKDNGTGIPADIRAKIFQPFFTTKPTGQGVGLGLSLSYDIITQGHGGELTVDSQEDQGAEFIIRLPIR